MARHGVTRTSTDTFHCGDYRYAKLSDAIAQAKRIAARGNATIPGNEEDAVVQDNGSGRQSDMD